MNHSTAASRVYVMASDSSELLTFELDHATGALAAVDSLVVGAGGKQAGACPMALRPDHRHLYVALRSEPYTLLSFGLDADSGLPRLAGEASLPHSMAFISTDQTSRWLLGASYPGNLLSVSSIDGDGVAGAPVQVVATRPNAHAVRADAANRYVLSSSLGGDVVQQFRFDAAGGTLTPNEPAETAVHAGAGPRHFVFDDGCRHVYLLNELDASVCAFAYAADTGALSLLQTISARPPGFTDAPAAADLHLTPSGRFLYASVRNSSTLATFRVSANDGRLEAAGHFAAPAQPRGFQIDPTGSYLICAGQRSHTVGVFAVDGRSGALSLIAEHPAGQGPNWVEIVPAPRR